jgi:hypothetical protein
MSVRAPLRNAVAPPPFAEVAPLEETSSDHLGDDVAQPLPSLPPLPVPLYIEPALSATAARWMASSSVYPMMQREPQRDTRLIIQVAVVGALLLIGTIAAIVWLFP